MTNRFFHKQAVLQFAQNIFRFTMKINSFDLEGFEFVSEGLFIVHMKGSTFQASSFEEMFNLNQSNMVGLTNKNPKFSKFYAILCCYFG